MCPNRHFGECSFLIFFENFKIEISSVLDWFWGVENDGLVAEDRRPIVFAVGQFFWWKMTKIDDCALPSTPNANLTPAINFSRKFTPNSPSLRLFWNKNFSTSKTKNLLSQNWRKISGLGVKCRDKSIAGVRFEFGVEGSVESSIFVNFRQFL
mgnify:CR=1 FL=1